jgi:hypothetical protein
LRNSGCYAERGPLGFFHTAALNSFAEEIEATALDVARAEASAIDSMATVVGRPLRLHVVGDCPSDEAARIVSAAGERYTERGGGPVWTYTHAWRDVARESWGSVSVLASCETREDVELARERGYATALVVDAFEGDRLSNSVLPCPAQTRGKSCAECRLCMDDTRLIGSGYSIGFEIHGDVVTQRRARVAMEEVR